MPIQIWTYIARLHQVIAAVLSQLAQKQCVQTLRIAILLGIGLRNINISQPLLITLVQSLEVVTGIRCNKRSSLVLHVHSSLVETKLKIPEERRIISDSLNCFFVRSADVTFCVTGVVIMACYVWQTTGNIFKLRSET